jgi:hypothetical protein
LDITRRLPPPRRAERLPYPLGDGEPLRPRQLLDFPQFAVLQEDLQSLCHDESLGDSCR